MMQQHRLFVHSISPMDGYTFAWVNDNMLGIL